MQSVRFVDLSLLSNNNWQQWDQIFCDGIQQKRCTYSVSPTVSLIRYAFHVHLFQVFSSYIQLTVRIDMEAEEIYFAPWCFSICTSGSDNMSSSFIYIPGFI